MKVIFGTGGESNRMHINKLYSSPINFRVIKSKRIKWAMFGENEKCTQNFGQKTLGYKTLRILWNE
jgi:hypothetical protein